MVQVTMIMKNYAWTFEGQIRVDISYFVGSKMVANKSFVHPIDVTLATILADAKAYAHTIMGYKISAEALNLEQYIGVPFTEEV